MKWLPNPETRAAVLRHPIFLAGLAVVLLLGLTAGVLVLADSVRGAGNASPTVVVAPVGTATTATSAKTASASGVTATTKATTTVRSSPGARTTSLGAVPAHTDLDIDGRTTDAKWLRIVYPPNSELHGWIDANDVDVAGDPSTLVVATAEPVVVVAAPTADRALLTSIASQPTPAPTGTPVPGTPAKGTPTSVSGKLPDLVIGSPPTIAGGKLFVPVINQGAGDAKGDLVVAVFAADGVRLLGGATLPNFTLQAGRSIDVGTGYAVTVDQTLVLVVDPNGTIDETDNTNNRLTVAISVGGQAGQPPGPFTTPAPEIIATLIAIATGTAESRIATPTP